MTILSVNLNKVAVVRNARAGHIPSMVEAAEHCLEAGAGGITVHPRPDQRHARPADVHELAALIRDRPGAELNVEGNPFPEFLELVRATKPAQCTLVPDAIGALTSDHGWNLAVDGARLRPVIRKLQDLGIRVSVFLEPDASRVEEARAIGADRIELYTEPYARAFGTDQEIGVMRGFAIAAQRAQEIGLGVNAGHDLNLDNLEHFCVGVPGLHEVSIGHALIAYALEVGLQPAVREYRKVLSGCERTHGV
ncbi:MAG TPA: pyridoxine 5'-phosphate synthase [Steroidobacteraceae bacterium]|nr:pyridoxine 5'-phosphate synthase [Steroidobacteraceae bacterium]